MDLQKKWVEKPFIKSYLFVYITEQEKPAALITKGVARFLYFSGQAAPMPDRLINDLKLLMTSPYELEVRDEDLQSGESVIFKAGPLKGLVGEIISYRSQKQLIVRIKSYDCSIVIPSRLN